MVVVMSDGIEKAKFISETGNSFDVQFNPTDIQLTAKASWQRQGEIATNDKLEFKKVEPRTLSMTLIFDTTTTNDDVRLTFVNHLMDTFVLREFMDINPAHQADGQGTLGPKKRNALLTFKWGKFDFFGALTSMDVKYTMFSKDGNPIRAEVKVALLEYVQQDSFDMGFGSSRNNITVPQVKLVQMEAGETLSALASALGMSTGALAAANGIVDPLAVAAGTILGAPFGR
jgi:hypothetical protein